MKIMKNVTKILTDFNNSLRLENQNFPSNSITSQFQHQPATLNKRVYM